MHLIFITQTQVKDTKKDGIDIGFYIIATFITILLLKNQYMIFYIIMEKKNGFIL
jgi:hypothetical protein